MIFISILFNSKSEGEIFSEILGGWIIAYGNTYLEIIRPPIPKIRNIMSEIYVIFFFIYFYWNSFFSLHITRYIITFIEDISKIK